MNLAETHSSAAPSSFSDLFATFTSSTGAASEDSAGSEQSVVDPYHWYMMASEWLGQDTLLSVASQTQSMVTTTVAFCLTNFVTLFVTVGNLAFQAILYLTLVYYFLDLDSNIVQVSLEGTVMSRSTRHRVT